MLQESEFKSLLEMRLEPFRQRCYCHHLEVFRLRWFLPGSPISSDTLGICGLGDGYLGAQAYFDLTVGFLSLGCCCVKCQSLTKWLSGHSRSDVTLCTLQLNVTWSKIRKISTTAAKNNYIFLLLIYHITNITISTSANFN